MKNRHRRAGEAKGYLDSLVIRGEELASFLSRRSKPPQVTLERIMRLVELAQKYQHTMKNSLGVVVKDTRASREKGRESQRSKCIAKLWECYNVVLESEVMHPSVSGKDETWSGAKKVDGHWKSEPISYYGDQFEHVVGDELYGYTAQGRTPIRDSNYNGDEGGEE